MGLDDTLDTFYKTPKISYEARNTSNKNHPDI